MIVPQMNVHIFINFCYHYLLLLQLLKRTTKSYSDHIYEAHRAAISIVVCDVWAPQPPVPCNPHQRRLLHFTYTTLKAKQVLHISFIWTTHMHVLKLAAAHWGNTFGRASWQWGECQTPTLTILLLDALKAQFLIVE